MLNFATCGWTSFQSCELLTKAESITVGLPSPTQLMNIRRPSTSTKLPVGFQSGFEKLDYSLLPSVPRRPRQPSKIQPAMRLASSAAAVMVHHARLAYAGRLRAKTNGKSDGST